MNEQQSNNNPKMYSVRDSKSEAFMRPFVARTAGEALRGFAREANDGTTIIGQYPEDFALFEVGYWSETTGLVYGYEQPKSMGCAFEYVKPQGGGVEPISKISN